MADQNFFTNDTYEVDINMDAYTANRRWILEDSDVDFAKILFTDSTDREFTTSQRYQTTSFVPNGTSIEITPATQPVLQDSTGLIASIPINVTDTGADDDMTGFIYGIDVLSAYVLSAGTNLTDFNGHLAALDVTAGNGWYVIIQRLGGSWYVMQASNY